MHWLLMILLYILCEFTCKKPIYSLKISNALQVKSKTDMLFLSKTFSVKIWWYCALLKLKREAEIMGFADMPTHIWCLWGQRWLVWARRESFKSRKLNSWYTCTYTCTLYQYNQVLLMTSSKLFRGATVTKKNLYVAPHRWVVQYSEDSLTQSLFY